MTCSAIDESVSIGGSRLHVHGMTIALPMLLILLGLAASSSAQQDSATSSAMTDMVATVPDSTAPATIDTSSTYAAPEPVSVPVPDSAGPSTVPSPQRIPLVAVSTLDARGLNTDEASTIADNLATRLQKAGKVRVMERSQMSQILKEQNFQQSGACDGGECAVEVGRVLGIDQMVVGSVGRVGSTWSLSLRLVSVASGEALRTSTRNQQGTIDQVLTELVPDAALELSGETVPERVAAPERRRLWPWIVGGAVVAGGAATAVVLLSQDDSSPASDTKATETPDFLIKW